MIYTAKFPSSAIQKKFQKNLSKISEEIQDKILKSIESLQNNPRPFGAKLFKQLSPPIQLYSYVAQYRIRIGNYRVLYDMDDERRIVWIFAVRNEGTYR